MNVDLTRIAGFPLGFNSGKGDVVTDGVCFKRQTRSLQELSAVLMDAKRVASRSDLYWTYSLVAAGNHSPLFTQRKLTFGLVLLPPGKIGVEYIKTHGHYHSCIPGSQIGYPEVYTHYFGVLYLLMQRRAAGQAAELDDCVLYRMVPGQSITIPPGYAHILINPSTEPGLMAGLYSLESIHNYGPIDQMRGAAYYLTEQDGEMHIQENPAYLVRPTLRILDPFVCPPFVPPHPGVPLWEAFTRQPERYAFLHDADAARLHFRPEDQRA